MLLRAKTGSATLFQFVANTALSFISGITSIVGGCYRIGAGECVTNAFVSLLLMLFVVGVFAILLVIGYLAQERRDQRLVILLVGFEIAACVIFLFDAKHTPSVTERLTNATQFVIAAWVIFIATRQFLAKGGRMVHLPKK